MIGVREPQPAASEAFVKFADAHRSIEKFGIRLLKTIKPVGHGAPVWPCVRAEKGGRVMQLESNTLASAKGDLQVVCVPCSPTESQLALAWPVFSSLKWTRPSSSARWL